jgi:hypothetical protein
MIVWNNWTPPGVTYRDHVERGFYRAVRIQGCGFAFGARANPSIRFLFHVAGLDCVIDKGLPRDTFEIDGNRVRVINL